MLSVCDVAVRLDLQLCGVYKAGGAGVALSEVKEVVQLAQSSRLPSLSATLGL